MQRIELIGNVGQDATIKNHNGRDFITFTVAVNERYKNADGVDVERTNWYNCAYQPQSTTVAKYITRGTKVFVEGKPKVSIYRNKDNQPTVDFGVQVRSVELLSGQKEEQKTPSETESKPERQPLMESVGETGSDDLPF